MDQAVKDRIKSIEPGLYAALGAGPRLSQYARTSGCNEVLRDACSIFGVSMYRLAFLLGCPHVGRIYQWTAGESRPSVKYMLRLVKLHQVELAGLRLITVRSVDWDTGVIHFKPRWDGKGWVAETSGAAGTSGETHRDIMAHFLSKSPR